MLTFYGADILKAVSDIAAKDDYVRNIKANEPAAIFKRDKIDYILGGMLAMLQVCKTLHLEKLKDDVERFCFALKQGKLTASEIYTDLHRIHVDFRMQLMQIRLVSLPKNKTQYFE